MKNIQMVDLKGQYEKIKVKIDTAINECIIDATFINGPQVKEFSSSLKNYLNCLEVIPCANGTDALQIAMMALDLKQGDEVIVPTFTYVATAEVIGLLGLVPVMVDVDPDSFNITVDAIENAITERTKAIVPVHLFGQCVDMDAIMELAAKHNLFVIEDAAQAIGADYVNKKGSTSKAGTIGHIGCTSFFPSKNLGCYGDGGAIYTNDPVLAEKIKMIANHGQIKKYVHKYIGVNSRLDSIQAAILNVKLAHLDEYIKARQEAAACYDLLLKDVPQVTCPKRMSYSTHVFHQYTIRVQKEFRDPLIRLLTDKQIPAMIYYPIPLNQQEAYREISKAAEDLSVSEGLCQTVLSLPMHTELIRAQQEYIVDAIKDFFKNGK